MLRKFCLYRICSSVAFFIDSLGYMVNRILFCEVASGLEIYDTLNFAVPTFLANKFCCGRVCCEVLAHIYTHMKNIITSLRLFPRHFFSIFHFPIFHYIIYAKHVSTLLQAHVSHTCVNQRSQQFIIWRVCRNL